MSIEQPTQAHTPGPWFAVAAADGETYISDSNAIVGGRIIARTTFVDDEEEDANARLIAAAPDLLKALDACETALAPVMANHACGDVPDSRPRCGECLGCMNWATWQMAVSALAKARGAS